MKKAIFNWSGGKDSAFALYKCLQNKEYDIASLFTSVSYENKRISMHGVRSELLYKQSELLDLPLVTISLPKQTSMEVYNNIMKTQMNNFKLQNIEYSVFGDIFLQDLREYREKQLSKIGMEAIFPLWKRDTKKLINEFIDAGFKAIVTAIDASKLEKEFVGRIVDKQFINDLPKDVDPCGENGEFHTFVYDAPIFKKQIEFSKGEIVRKEYEAGTCKEFKDSEKQVEVKRFGFWFCDLIPK